MKKLNIVKAKNELPALAAYCIKNNDIININTKEGNVILLSKSKYDSLIESLYLVGVKGVYESIGDAVKTPTTNHSKDAPWE